MSELTLSILIPTHNRSDLLAKTLESLGKVKPAEGAAVDVLVVANACRDDTVEVAQRGLAALPWPSRVVEEATPGLNVARTRAVEDSRGEVCAFLDDDVWLDEGWLVGVQRAYTVHAGDVVGGRIDLWWEAVQRPDWLPEMAESLLSRNDLGDKVKELTSSTGIVGANFSFRRSVYDRIQGFRPGLDRVGKQLVGGGDSDFAYRALEAGCRVIYAPDARLKHWVAPERLTRRYLMGVSAGTAMGRVFMKKPFSTGVALRALVGHAWLAVREGFGVVGAMATRNKRAEIAHRCRCAKGRGGVRAVFKRWATA